MKRLVVIFLALLVLAGGFLAGRLTGGQYRYETVTGEAAILEKLCSQENHSLIVRQGADVYTLECSKAQCDGVQAGETVRCKRSQLPDFHTGRMQVIYVGSQKLTWDGPVK